LKRKYSSLPAITVGVLALLIRLLYNLTVARHYYAKYDAALYNHIAYNIVSHHCFCIYSNQPALSRPPLWPFILSIFYLLPPQPNPQLLDSGAQVFYGRLLYCFLGSFTCILIYLLARDLFGTRIAFITGVIAALYPGLFIYDGWLYTESLYTFLVTAFIYSLYRLQRTAQRRWIILSGLLLGLETLTRPNGAVFFGMLLCWSLAVILANILSWQTVVKSTLGITCIAVVLILPWTYRNYQVSHAFVPVSIGEGEVLLGAYNDTVLRGTTGWWTSPRYITPRPNVPPMVLKNHDAVGYTPEDDKIATDYALHWIQAHWRDIPRMISYHWNSMWSSYTPDNNLPYKEYPDQLSSQVVEYMMLLIAPLIFLLATFGLLVTWQRFRKQLLIIYFVIALTIAQNLVYYGSMRFRAPIEPLLVLLAGGALWWITSNDPGTLHYRRKQKIAHRSMVYCSQRKTQKRTMDI
jgi:4-amino-4-deoxy-L-arabinose transferase-like glycosyltransferase